MLETAPTTERFAQSQRTTVEYAEWMARSFGASDKSSVERVEAGRFSDSQRSDSPILSSGTTGVPSIGINKRVAQQSNETAAQFLRGSELQVETPGEGDTR